MLPKENRLVTREDFKAVFRGRLRARRGPFQLVCEKNNISKARFGFVVSLSVSKKAVRRNKLRRQLHEIVRATLSSKISDYDCVIRAYAGSDELSYDDIEKHIVEMFKKVAILHNTEHK